MLNFLLVDNLMDKYGEGSTQIHKCQTCEYEKKIYSGGTHISEGGSLMVYAEEDEFVCPNCDPSAVDGNDSDAGKRVNIIIIHFIPLHHYWYIGYIVDEICLKWT